jgi:hypothetical protein
MTEHPRALQPRRFVFTQAGRRQFGSGAPTDRLLRVVYARTQAEAVRKFVRGQR